LRLGSACSPDAFSAAKVVSAAVPKAVEEDQDPKLLRCPPPTVLAERQPRAPAVQATGVAASPRPTLMQRRRAAFKVQLPAIDCGLAAEQDAACDPFRSAGCQSIAERFEVFEALGQGSTGVVYRARPRSGDGQVALKVLRMDDEEMLRIAQGEYELLRGLEHPHIVRALDFFTYPRGAVLVLDFFQGQSLEATIRAMPAGRLLEATARDLFAALMSALEHLHRHNILHRDVKAANVLVSDDMRDLRLIDFNTARQVLEGGALTMTGTADYLPPEVLLGEPHSEGSDVWAAGLCLRLMLSGSLPLERRLFASHGDFGRAVTSQAARLGGPQWEHASPECKEVLQRCLTVDPAERPGASQVLACTWLRDVRAPVPVPVASA